MITDELREWAHARFVGLLSSEWEREVDEIADRIDDEHEAKVSYWQGASYKDGYDEGFASADDWLAQHEDAMAEHGWIRLPVDADGVPIHVGDKLTDTERQSIGLGPTEVRCILYNDEGCVVSANDPHGYWYDPSLLRHHCAPTVEDVLREFAQRWDDPVHYAKGELVEQYAAKLRLAGDAE